MISGISGFLLRPFKENSTRFLSGSLEKILSLPAKLSSESGEKATVIRHERSGTMFRSEHLSSCLLKPVPFTVTSCILRSAFPTFLIVTLRIATLFTSTLSNSKNSGVILMAGICCGGGGVGAQALKKSIKINKPKNC